MKIAYKLNEIFQKDTNSPFKVFFACYKQNHRIITLTRSSSPLFDLNMKLDNQYQTDSDRQYDALNFLRSIMFSFFFLHKNNIIFGPLMEIELSCPFGQNSNKIFEVINFYNSKEETGPEFSELLEEFRPFLNARFKGGEVSEDLIKMFLYRHDMIQLLVYFHALFTGDITIISALHSLNLNIKNFLYFTKAIQNFSLKVPKRKRFIKKKKIASN
jgi:hypothetical protein